MRTNRVIGALAVALLSSCADYGAPDEVLYGEAVYTQPAPGADFSGGLVYYLDTTYRSVDGEDISDEVLPSAVATAITTNMAALGYTAATGATENEKLLNADVGIKLAVLKGDVAYYYGGYWCDYWYYYSCYYDWYYAGSYDVGSVIMEMGDLSGYTGPPGPGADPGVLPIMWLSAMYGVASTTAVDIPRAVDSINRAFAQSPYLKTN